MTEHILKTGKTDRAMCLMDIPDDWDMEFQIEPSIGNYRTEILRSVFLYAIIMPSEAYSFNSICVKLCVK